MFAKCTEKERPRMNGNELGSDARFQPVFDKGLMSETVPATGTDASFIANGSI